MFFLRLQILEVRNVHQAICQILNKTEREELNVFDHFNAFSRKWLSFSQSSVTGFSSKINWRNLGKVSTSSWYNYISRMKNYSKFCWNMCKYEVIYMNLYKLYLQILMPFNTTLIPSPCGSRLWIPSMRIWNRFKNTSPKKLKKN